MVTAKRLTILDRVLFGGILAALVIATIATDALRRIDYVLYDSLLVFVPTIPDPNVAIIAIDEASLAELGQWPWPRDLHTRLIQQLTQAESAAIVFDVLFTEPDRDHPGRDIALAQAMREQKAVVLPLHIDRRGNGAPLSEIMPLPELIDAAARIGHAHVELDQDGIARGLFLYQGVGKADWPALSLALLRQQHPEKAERYAAPTSDSTETSVWFNVRESFRLIPFAGPTGTIPTHSYADVLNGRLPPDALRNKVLFIGATAAGLGDVLPTPFSGLASPMPGVEVHANTFNALKHDRLIETLTKPWQLGLSLVVALIPVFLFPRLSPERNLPLALGLLAAAPIATFLLLAFGGLWLGPAPAMAALFLAYPLWSWRRLARLNRYLSQELQRLSQEPSLTNMEKGTGFESWFEQVLALLEPSEHSLYINGQKISGNAAFSKIPLDLPPDRWVLRDGFWWLSQSLGPRQAYQAAMRWQQHTDPTLLEASLGNLLPHMNQSLSGSYRRTEVIERRIQQVQTAIASMRAMRQFISDSFQSMPDGILVTDRLGGVLFVNSHCQNWFPTAAEGTRATNLLDWLKPYPPLGSQSWPQLIREVLISGRPVSVGLRLPERDLLVQMVPFAATDSHDSGLIASFSDISHVREEQRRRMETIDFVSHDLRAPLVSQLALLEQMIGSRIEHHAQEADQPPGEHQLDLLRRAQAYTRKSLDLADQFLQLTRVEAAEEIKFHDCDLLAVLENAVDQVMDQARERQIAVTISEESEETWMMGNAELLERVIVNLLTNAIKYSPPNTQVNAAIHSDAEHILLEIKDHGRGIDSAQVPQIFERFRQAPNFDRQRVTSAGLGLRFVKLVVERHEGHIEIDSEPGRGTVFQVRFPRAS